MRVVNTLIIAILAHLWLCPGSSTAQDDFDMDALFEGMDDYETVEPEDDPAGEPAEAEAVEEEEDVPAEEGTSDAMTDDLFDAEPMEEPAAEPEMDEPMADEPASEPMTDDLFDAEPMEEPAAEPEMDEPTAGEPASEPMTDEPADADDPFADDLFDFEDEAVDAEPMDEPATEPEPEQEPGDDPFTDDYFLFDEEPMEDPADEPAMEMEPEAEADMAAEAEPEEAEEEVDPEVVARDVAAQEEIRRQAAEVEGLKSLDAGFRALDNEEFQRARDAFEVARNQIPDRPATQDLRERARWGLAESHYRIAQEVYREDGDMRVARQNIDAAVRLSPGHRGVSFLSRRIAREEARRMAEDARPVPVEDRPDIAEKRQTIAELMREGRAYYEAGELDRAEILFENVLVRDDYNHDAMRYLRRIAEDKRRASDRLRETTSSQMIQQVRDAWNPPRRDDVTLPEDAMGPGPVDTETPAVRLRNKMENIIIPRIEFRQANIRDVISFLRDASEAADPEGEGVNIILNMNMPEGTAPAPSPSPAAGGFDDPWGDDDPWGGVAAPAPEPAGVSGVPTITLNLRRISLMEAIRYITEVAGLRHRIEDNVVVITPAGIADVGRVITRLYPVQPSFLDLVQERQGEEPAAATGFGEFGARRPQPSAGRGAEVKNFFEGAGVPFPAGTSITYNPTISQLIVANTPENLDKFERILSQLNVVPNQVEIEARFVEVAEEDLQELGLQWLFTDNYEFLQRGSGPIGSSERIQVDAGNASRGMRFFGVSADEQRLVTPISTATAIDPTFAGNILSISSVLTNPEMRVVLHALAQSGNTDLLSAPRVTTRSGVNASIEVVREIIYPTEFRVTEPTITAASGASGSAVVSPPTVTPDNFETRRTGVILNVTPTVGPDGYTIDLALAPEVAELVDWLQYGSRLRVPNPDSPGEFQEFVYNIPQPVFASRNVSTSIVIWDGQTVVMGGLMRETLITIEDKVPILGDIPLLGRLFRTEGSQSRKENLLIFVTARLVDPAGKPIHRADAMTMPTGDQ